MFLVQARVTVDGRRGEIPGAIKGDQIMAVEKHHGFKRLPMLELSKDEREGMPQGLRGNGIEALEQLEKFHVPEITNPPSALRPCPCGNAIPEAISASGSSPQTSAWARSS